MIERNVRKMKTKPLSLICLIFLIFQSCGAPKYGCPYGEGVTCKSVDTVYRDSLSGELEKKKEEQRTLRQIVIKIKLTDYIISSPRTLMDQTQT